jgi:beta-phosphoglucomutase-like phosphatase (HAD superfamily)
MFRHLIFHLNSLADPLLLRAHYQLGLAKIMQQRYGQPQQFWVDIQTQIFADWDSYHADLNYSGEDGMADMREGRFRLTCALFRLAKIPEPPKQEITQLADDLIAQAPKCADALGQDSIDLLLMLHKQGYFLSIISYYPEQQVQAILCGADIEEKISYVIGANTFEQFDMNSRYFMSLVNHLRCQPPECIYIDNQDEVIEAAAQLGMKTLYVKYCSTSQFTASCPQFADNLSQK